MVVLGGAGLEEFPRLSGLSFPAIGPPVVHQVVKPFKKRGETGGTDGT